MYNILTCDDEQIMIDSLQFIIKKNFEETAAPGLQAQCAFSPAERWLCTAAARSRHSLQGKPQSRWPQNLPVEGNGRRVNV